MSDLYALGLREPIMERITGKCNSVKTAATNLLGELTYIGDKRPDLIGKDNQAEIQAGMTKLKSALVHIRETLEAVIEPEDCPLFDELDGQT